MRKEREIYMVIARCEIASKIRHKMLIEEKARKMVTSHSTGLFAAVNRF